MRRDQRRHLSGAAAEITELDGVRGAQQEVLELEVPMDDRGLKAVQVLHGAAGLVEDLEHEAHVECGGRWRARRDCRGGGRIRGIGGPGTAAPRPASPGVSAAARRGASTQVLEHVDQAAARAELHHDQKLAA